MHQRAQRVGIALKVDQVVPLPGRKLVFQCQTGPLAEVGPDGLLARVAEWRVAQVVCQAGSGNNLAHVTQFVDPRLALVARHEPDGYLAGQRFAHTRHLQAVCQAVVDKDAARQRKHLCLVLQAAERRREHQSVVVALKVAANAPFGVVVVLKSQPLVTD